jgi:spore maturation protein CgeB
MKILYFGPISGGATGLQRLNAFGRLPGIEAIGVDSLDGMRPGTSTYSRVRFKLGWPVDTANENDRLLAAVERVRPDIAFVDKSLVLKGSTLKLARRNAGLLVYYSPDDFMAPHHLKAPLRHSLGIWDLIFTTKTYNVSELKGLGARRVVLAGNSFDPALHRPLTPAEVGPDFEAFDCVFVGAYETERAQSLCALAKAGVRVVVYGASARLQAGEWNTVAESGVVVRPSAFGEQYTKALHHGRVALCFLRKVNRDLITTRSIEIPGAGRPMLAEHSVEHDAHFVEGVEYVAFSRDVELIKNVRKLLSSKGMRCALAQAGLERCKRSGYSVQDRARQMLATMEPLLVL